MKKILFCAVSLLTVGVYLVATQITIFVIAPMGAVPEGRTVVITRLENVKFIDSADSICERVQGGVSLLCRAITMKAIFEKSDVLLKLPYSSWLYSISTDGKVYER